MELPISYGIQLVRKLLRIADVKAVRTLVVSLILLLPYLYTPSETGSLGHLLWRIKTPKGWDTSEQKKALSALLDAQGKDAGACFAYAGSPDLLNFWKTETLESLDQRYRVLSLCEWGYSVPGLWIERYLLFDEKGTLLDVATVVWSTRLMERFRSVDGRDVGSACFREIQDLRCEQPWGNYDPPSILLGLQNPREIRNLSWTGTSRLGVLSVDRGAFTVRVPK